MPRKPIDYSKTHFYKIVCRDTSITDCYVGMTTSLLSKRKSQHKFCCLNDTDKHYNLHLYQFIRANGGWDNFEMVLIETECLDNALEAGKRERFYKEQLNSSLNIQVPSRNDKEYREDNRDILLYKKKIFCENNKEQIKKYKRKHYENNKEKVVAKCKEYRDKQKMLRENTKKQLNLKSQS